LHITNTIKETWVGVYRKMGWLKNY